MFEQLEMAPPDAILGLTEAFKLDPTPNKINLSVGIYKDGVGNTPVLASVKEAERRLLEREKTKSYLPIEGSLEYGAAVRGLLFGSNHELVANGRAVTAHTPGGTGALRVAADFVRAVAPSAGVWFSDPTWPNHPGIFASTGLAVKTYPYFDAKTNGLKWDAMLAALSQAPQGDVVVLHGCCHNPTGIDPNAAQWDVLANTLRERQLLPILDFAYQGLGDGLAEDALGLQALSARVPELIVCSSFSKNFGLYSERVGALTLLLSSSERAERALSHLRLAIRTNYSNPPSHGAAAVALVLGDPELRARWENEVSDMRNRINGMRQLFVTTLAAKGVTQDFSFLKSQRGMFSFSGLNKAQVEALRRDYAIYVVGSGRINVAGMTEGNMDRLCTAIAAVLQSSS